MFSSRAPGRRGKRLQELVAPLAEVSRGNRQESIHSGVVVVASASGGVLQSSGNPETFAYFRSSGKPFQAIPIVESGAADTFGFTPAELALACASHTGELHHQQQVAKMLDKLDLSPDYLQCGSPLPWDARAAAQVLEGKVERSPLQCDCSGKHAGMLAVCRKEGFALDSYLDSQHPLQKEILETMATVCDIPAESITLAIDGCSVPTFGMPVAQFASAYATLADPHRACSAHAVALDRLRETMMSFPYNVGGSGMFVSDLMDMFDGEVVAKIGAEGLMCIGIPAHGIGIAIRVADGAFRPHPAVVLQVLDDLDVVDSGKLGMLADKYPPIVTNHNGWEVGRIRSLVRFDPIPAVG